MVNAFLVPPAGSAAPAPSPDAAPPAAPVNDPRPVKVHKIAYAAGVAGEVLVVVLCLVSIYLSADRDGGGAAEILVIRSAMALIELGRIPMAYLARKLGSPAWRSFCFACVLVMGFITAINIFTPYNEAVRKLIAGPDITAANIAEVEQKGARLHDEVLAKRAAHDGAQKRVTSAAEALGKLPKGATGRISLQGNLTEARKAEQTAETEVKTAEKNEKDFGGKRQAELDAAKERHRKEISGNLIYGAAATLTLSDPAAISPQAMSTAILAITIIPSLVAGFLMSAICLASVERLPVPKAPRARNPATMEIIKAASGEIKREAAAEVIKDVATVFRSASAEAMKPAPSNGNEPKKSPMGEALGAFLKETKLARMPTRRTARKNAAPRASGNGAAAPAKAAKPRRAATSPESPPAH